MCSQLQPSVFSPSSEPKTWEPEVIEEALVSAAIALRDWHDDAVDASLAVRRGDRFRAVVPWSVDDSWMGHEKVKVGSARWPCAQPLLRRCSSGRPARTFLRTH